MAHNTKLLPLTEEQQRFIENNVLIIRTMVESLTEEGSPDSTLPWTHPERLDAAYGAWYAEHNRVEEDPAPMLTAFGVGFGEYLIAEFNLKWAFANDKKGNGLVLTGMPGKLLLFPDRLLQKHYDRGDLCFFSTLAARYSKLLARINGL
ncbi:MAG: DUF3806 domain-containing protein [Anaerolineales bacterium]|nr:DUF3806 domain-containing protein [Anaerolineales bacterium]